MNLLWVFILVAIAGIFGLWPAIIVIALLFLIGTFFYD